MVARRKRKVKGKNTQTLQKLVDKVILAYYNVSIQNKKGGMVVRSETARIKLKGYKKFMKRIRNIRKETEKLNRTIERAVELRKELF